MKGVAIVSGGMDSVTMAHMLRRDVEDLELVIASFNYGQRHVKELTCARQCAQDLNAEFKLVRMDFMSELLHGSALTSKDVDVPEGHYAEDTMKQTVVPNRNAIMLSIATGIAVAEGAWFVAAGVHAGDHFVYPDCRPEFIGWMNAAMKAGNEGFIDAAFYIATPFINMSKAEIVEAGDQLHVNWKHTWSCYKGGTVHCGVCGTCTERREAFELAGVKDPTEYTDLTKHWGEKPYVPRQEEAWCSIHKCSPNDCFEIHYPYASKEGRV